MAGLISAPHLHHIKVNQNISVGIPSIDCPYYRFRVTLQEFCCVFHPYSEAAVFSVSMYSTT